MKAQEKGLRLDQGVTAYATVAEVREAAKLIMDGYVQGYDSLASSFAASWYDRQAEANGAKLRQAVTSAVYAPRKTDSVARYQVKKLTKEGPAAFAKACGEYARNDALRALNETIVANAERDRKEGVRFARVPAGRETCTFCLMLAGRGAVYHTRQAAGEFRHFHRGCDCKVIPGFEDDPDAELVEGYRPRELRDQWKAFADIEKIGLPPAQEAAIKAAYIDSKGSPVLQQATSSTELAALFDKGINDALNRFKKSKTLASYDDNVNSFLAVFGEIYGVELAGERFNNSKGKCVGAAPNGEELWIAIKMRENGTFLYASYEHPSVDFETEDSYVEFKAPRSTRKINDLLVNAAKKFAAYRGKKSVAVLNMLNLPDANSEAITSARNFTGDKTFDDVMVVDSNGCIVE